MKSQKIKIFSWLLALTVLISPLSAQALTFNITYDSSLTSQANAAQIETDFGIATQLMQTLYTNASSVNITVYWGDNGPFTNGIDLGASHTEAVGYYTYAQLTDALRASRTTLADSNAVASLPASDPVANNQWIIPRAEAKALGLSTYYGIPVNDASTTDGEIGFASNVSYNFNPTNRTAVFGDYDFISVAEHEISEVMGRGTFGLNDSGNYVPYDLFRFTAGGVRSFNVNDTGVYFSVNNGATVLKYFYDDINTGDIQDWATSTPPDSYDAFISNGEEGRLSSADLTSLDVIGYNLNFLAPQLTGAALAGGNFKVGFTNVTGLGFAVLATTNLTIATTNWTNLGIPTESLIGQYQFTDTQATTNKARFYRVSLP